jgi:hypothetical protein
MKLTSHQLLWSVIQAREQAGGTPRKDREEAEMEARSKAAGELMAWADTHISRPGRKGV